MSEEQISEQALARKKKFLEKKHEFGDYKTLMEHNKHKLYYLYFDADGEIMSLTKEPPEKINPLWKTYEFDQHLLATLVDKDINKFWVTTDSTGVSTIQLKPVGTVYVQLAEEDLLSVEFSNDDNTDYEMSVSITATDLFLSLSDTAKQMFSDVYPIQATVKGKRILKFFLADPAKHDIIYHTESVSLVELLTEDKVRKELPADLRHCTINTVPVFDKYIRV